MTIERKRGSNALSTLAVCTAIFGVILAGCACQCGGDSKGIEGSGIVTTEERAVSGISAVIVANQGDLIIEFGETERLVIEAEDNLIEHIDVRVSGGSLKIATKQGVGSLRNKEPIRYHLTVKELTAVTATSAGDITAPAIETERFSIRASSAGDVRIEALTAKSLSASLSSAGDVVIGGGSVDEQNITVSSAGDYDARGMKSVRAHVSVSSAGDATVWVTEELRGDLSSVGDLHYVGDPKVEVHSSSQGKVLKLSTDA